MAQQKSAARGVLSGVLEGLSIRASEASEPDLVKIPETDELPEIVETATPEVGLAPEGHIFLVLPPGEVVTTTMATAAAAEVERLAGTRSMPVLLVLTGVEAITRGARTVFSSAGSLAAVAVLGVSPVDRVIANFLLGGTAQPCPTRYFSTELEALGWLKRRETIA